MTARKRALIIGMAGPAVQAVGIAWQGLHLLTGHFTGSFDARHLVFEPGTLVIVVGFLLSLVLIPVAFEVLEAAPEELELPLLGAQPQEHEGRRASRGWSG